MASPQLEALRQKIDDLSSVYSARFAGQSRVTRDLQEIDELVDKSREVVSSLESLPADARGEDYASLLDQAKQSLALYEGERVAIAQAKATQDPDLELFARLGTQANFVFARYRRHFAGKARPTRDLGLLAEMIDDLTKIQQQMTPIVAKKKGVSGLAQDLELVTSNLKLYLAERGEIADARGSGTPEEQADILAEVANGQFRVYRDHFANKSRVSRRPQLLQRVISNLETVKDRMTGLQKAGLRSDQNAKNIDVVDGNLKLYRTELAEIKKARASVKLADLMGSLGGAANDVMQEYDQEFAGKARKGRDLELLSSLCDRLGELARQMNDLGRAEVQEFNLRNLQITTDNLVMLEAEYDEVLKANQGSLALNG
jgi:hypothetical protein